LTVWPVWVPSTIEGSAFGKEQEQDVKVDLRLMALPALARAIGGKKVEVDFAGGTVADLLNHLVEQHGSPAREALLDDEGQLDSIVQILVNEKQWVVHDELEVPLKDGDSVVFMLLVVGG
jgi:molybdopterin converting factor small subunit